MKPPATRSGKGLRSAVMALALAVAAASPVGAAESGDHDRARKALEAGEILPLHTVLEGVSREVPGQVMEVELERKHDRWFYEVKLLRPGGALVKLLVNASDGTIVDRRVRDDKLERRKGE